VPRDPLATVLRLRQHAVEEARRAVAVSLATAGAAADAARAAEQAIEREAELASDPEGDDSLVEAFAAWLPSARHHAAQARAMHERHEAEAARCRASLAACRTALETIESLVAQRESEAAKSQARRMQQALDESAWLEPEVRG
jgi:flagellar biosynthesis chaperone FliJ